MILNSQLVGILQCPDCKGSIKYQKAPEKLSCTKCKRVFKIKHGIPAMTLKNST